MISPCVRCTRWTTVTDATEHYHYRRGRDRRYSSRLSSRTLLSSPKLSCFNVEAIFGNINKDGGGGGSVNYCCGNHQHSNDVDQQERTLRREKFLDIEQERFERQKRKRREGFVMREDTVPEPRRSLFTFTHLFTAVEIKRRFDATWSVNGLLWEHYIVRQRCLIWSFLIGSSQVALHLPHSSCKSEVNLHHIFETRCSLFLDTKRFYSFLHYSVILSSSHWIILPFPRVFLFFVSPFNAWLAPFVQPARTEGYGREGGETRALISISRQRNEMSVSPAHDATL